MITLMVEGMQCGHCIKRITQAIHRVDPDALVSVDLAAKTVDVRSENEPDQVAGAIDELGYRVVDVVKNAIGLKRVDATGGCCCKRTGA